MQVWKSGFQSANSGATINYDPAGSSAGREQFISGGVEFAGSDSYLSDDELQQAQDQCGGPAIEYPVYVSPIAVIYNLSGVDSLQLSPQTLAPIFAAKITKWNDPAIAADNPDATLPDQDINAVHRSDGSGTTDNFTDYLDAVEVVDNGDGADVVGHLDGGRPAARLLRGRDLGVVEVGVRAGELHATCQELLHAGTRAGRVVVHGHVRVGGLEPCLPGALGGLLGARAGAVERAVQGAAGSGGCVTGPAPRGGLVARAASSEGQTEHNCGCARRSGSADGSDLHFGFLLCSVRTHWSGRVRS